MKRREDNPMNWRKRREHPLFDRMEIDPVAYDVTQDLVNMEQDAELRRFARQMRRVLGWLVWTAWSVWAGWVLRGVFG